MYVRKKWQSQTKSGRVKLIFSKKKRQEYSGASEETHYLVTVVELGNNSGINQKNHKTKLPKGTCLTIGSGIRYNTSLLAT